MRNPKTMLALVLAAIVLTAWAGNTVVTRKARSDKDDRTVIAQVQPAREDEKPDQATQSRPKEDQSPKSKDRDARAPESRSDAAQDSKSEHKAEKAPEYKSDEVQAPASSERREPRVVADPTPAVRTGSKGTGSSRSGDASEYNIPQSIGEPSRPRGGGTPGGYKGGYGNSHFDRRPSHFPGGRGWHGRREEWRHRHFSGSWRFLFYLGPRIYYPPIHYPHIIRIPHDRVGVYVRYTGEDGVGSSFANAVREHLREQGLRVVYSQDDARLELYIISMEQDPDDPGYGSSISVSYVWYPGHKFITAQMVDAGLNEVDDLAVSVAGYADELVDDYR
jgi:hypothetical protein